jgi:RNA polymerase sigma-70 factor (ECF subfamily)
LSKLSVDFIVEGIISLPVIYKDVLYLSYVEDLNIQEISKLINISNESVKKRLQRGRKILLKNLKIES